MDIRRITSLGRPLDLSNTGNFLIILITAIVFTASTLYYYIFTETIIIAFFHSIRTSLVIFLTWAISRELDPDHAFSAFIPLTFVLIIISFFEAPSILPMFWIILILRAINRTAGISVGILDILVILSLGTLLVFKASWIYGLLTSLGLLADSRLPSSAGLQFKAGIFMAIVSFFSLMLKDVSLPVLSDPDFPILIVTTILFLPVILGSSEIQSVGDRTGERLDPTRIRAAQLMALTVVLSLSIGGVNGWLYVMYCILAGIGIYWVFSGRVTVT
ncbi:MAG: hypothetical protein SCH66_12785 [Methanolobus sp.]|nr:hypothetical protein [Methanolobus sp.]